MFYEFRITPDLSVSPFLRKAALHKMDGSRASVRRRYRSDLRVGITANDLCDLRLSAIGRFLTDKEYDMILFQSVNTSQVDELIEVLLKTENGYFDSFFAVLENHSCNRMGKRLKEEGTYVREWCPAKNEIKLPVAN